MNNLKIVNEEENIHHLFTKAEVKRAIMRIIGKPQKEEDYSYLDKEIKSIWNKLPKFVVNKEEHKQYHNQESIPILEIRNILSKKQIEELVIGGIKCFKKDKKQDIQFQSNLIKRIVGQIYGYIHNHIETEVIEESAGVGK